MDYIFAVFLGYRNGLIAKRKGKNTILWVVWTVLAFMAGQFIGSIFIFARYYTGSLGEQMTPEQIGQIQQQFMEFMEANPLSVFFLFFCGLGGYLFIYYLLSRMPDKPKQDEIL